MLITPAVIAYLLDRVKWLEEMTARQSDLLRAYADDHDRLKAENRRLEAELIQARLNCQEIRV